ncbi:DNA-directed RNA polymerase [Bisporella sp. PMI_857]|nr:DNA-directed RNA polymerase [Bisporella sp. PMI_857]
MAPATYKTPSQAEVDRRKIVGVNAETVTDVSSRDYPGNFPGEDNSWDKRKFNTTFDVQFHTLSDYDATFSLIGLDASVANAFRRILIAEIPSLAVEWVYVNNNTSIIQDEVLAARLGLIPFKGGREGLLKFLKWYKKPEEGEERENGMDWNTIALELKVECTRNPDAAKGEKDPTKKYHNTHVYAKDIKFQPFGRQEQYFSGEDAIAPTNPDILIAKLRPGQVIDIQMHAIKGIGSDHAKFSPVATASYRLLPTIDILRPIIGKDAEKFCKCFPKGVIGLEPITKKEALQAGSGYEGHEGKMKAVVLDPMKDTVSRECLRHDEFNKKGAEKVRLGRVRDHFIFSVESVGQWKSDELFLESVAHLKAKATSLRAMMSTIREK